jgi:hypothetical protein
LRRRLLLSYLTITIFTLFVLVYPLGRVFALRERDRLLRDIEHDASAVVSLSEDALEGGQRPDIAKVLADYARDPGGRIVVLDRTGRLVADSADPTATGADFSGRPEVAAALNGGRAEGSRHSDTLGHDLVYVAIPVASSGVVHGVVRITYPTSTLDARVRVQLRDEIRRVQLAEGITTLFVTHDQSEALAVADRVAVLNAGRLEQVDVPQTVYARPATPFVAEFEGVMNTVPIAGERIVPSATEQVQVRPEGLRVGAADDIGGDGIAGTVLTSTFLGAVTRLVVTTEVGELTVDAVSHPGLPGIGDTTTVGLA